MKRLLVLVPLVLAASVAQARFQGPIQVLTGPDPVTGSAQVLFEPKTQFPAQGGIALKAAFLPVGTVFLMGGQGEVMLDDSFGIGVASYSLSSELAPTLGGVKTDIGMTYGGILVDDSFLPKRLFYLNTSVTLGFGEAWRLERRNGAERDYCSFGVVEPEMNLYLNATKEARFGVSVGWRFFYGASTADVVGVDLGGPSAMFSLLYGKL
jgi:hypothetical protein